MPVNNLNDIIVNDLGMMWDDWAETVTYRRTTSTTYAPKAGTNTPTTSDTSTKAIRGAYNAQQAGASPELRIGGVWFKLRVSDLGFNPTQRDQIIDGSETFEVTSARLEPDENVWHVDVKRQHS